MAHVRDVQREEERTEAAALAEASAQEHWPRGHPVRLAGDEVVTVHCLEGPQEPAAEPQCCQPPPQGGPADTVVGLGEVEEGEVRLLLLGNALPQHGVYHEAAVSAGPIAPEPVLDFSEVLVEI